MIADDDEARRGNGPGDAIAAVSARTLISASEAALAWPPADNARFPGGGGFCVGDCATLTFYCDQFSECCAEADVVCDGGSLAVDQLEFQRGVGTFLRNSETGFRGLDFQARLAWEQQLGSCENASTPDDFVSELLQAAQDDGDATVRDVVLALKDRLIGEPSIADAQEEAALEDLLEVGLADGAGELDEGPLRHLCGVLLSTPQFLLQGIAGRGGDQPRLTPASASYGAVCDDLASRTLDELTVSCENDALTIDRP